MLFLLKEQRNSFELRMNETFQWEVIELKFSQEITRRKIPVMFQEKQYFEWEFFPNFCDPHVGLK